MAKQTSGSSGSAPHSRKPASKKKNAGARAKSSGGAGSRGATIYDVAKVAKVSTFTVSAVLNGSTYVSPLLTKRVREAAESLDYTINALARGAQKGHTRTVGMLIPDIANALYALVVRGVEDKLRNNGYSLILGNTYNTPEEQSRYLNVFRSKRVDGILLFAAFGDQSEIRRLVEKRMPLGLIARGPVGFDADVVASDNFSGTQQVMQFLISKGHTRIAIITGPRSLTTTSARLNGWREALRRGRLPVESSYVGESDLTSQSGYRLTQRFLGSDRPPSAIFVTNLTTLTGVLRAVKEREAASPGHVEVVASDDSEWLDVLNPPIARLDQRSYEMGARAAELLLKRIEHPNRAYEKVLIEPIMRIPSLPTESDLTLDYAMR